MADINPKDVDEFLTKVTEIEEIVKGFRSENEDTVKNVMSKADKILEKVEKDKKIKDVDGKEAEAGLPKTKTGFNKTSINKSLPADDTRPGANDPNYDGMDQAGFMKVLEADAQERAQRRKQRETVANGIKDKGNEEFKQGNYEQALEFYTQALREVKDNTVLYTNRAQTYIKLQKYPEALHDCVWALRVFPNCLKAHIHMGRAHLGLKEYKEARECYKKALTCDPKKEAMINDYLAEVDRSEKTDLQEQDAEKVFKTGNPEDVGIVEILTRVQKTEQLPLFYSGGFRVLKTLLVSTSDRTLFRTNGGIETFTKHAALSKCLSASPKSLNQEELDMLTAAFIMYTDACKDNEKSTEMLLQSEGFSKICSRFLEVKMKGQGKVLKSSIIDCLLALSQIEIGRRHIVTSFDVPKLLALMFSSIRTNTKTAAPAASLLNNLALEKKFKSYLRDKIDETVSPAFEQLLSESMSIPVLPSCVTMVLNLTADKFIRTKLSLRVKLWEGCSNLISLHRQKLDDKLSVEILECVLGLLLNLTTEQSQYLREFGANICENCLAMIQENACAHNLVVRGLGLMSHILPHCIPAVDVVVEKGGTDIVLRHVKSEETDAMKAALKCMTALTQISQEARQYVVDNKGLGCLVGHLKSSDETVVGNTALCLSHCTQVKKVCASLARTDIMKELLVLARDGKRPAVQQNCAILIAKLAQGDSKHLERLRDLHGIEILHSCMKYLK